MKVRNFFIAITIIATVAGCNSGSNPEAVQQEITQKKKEIATLQKEVQELEKKLEKDSVYKVPVFLKEMKPEVFRHQIEVNGSVEAELQATISPETNGQIRAIHVEEGQHVSKGQLLMELNTEVTRKSINEIETSLELAKTTFEKQKKLWEQNIGSEMQYLQAKNQKESLESRLETMKAQLDMARVKAPFAGIVDDIMMKKGDLAMPGARAMTMVNLSKLKVNADVSEAYLSKIEKGDTVILEFPAFPELQLQAPIYRTGNIIQPDNRTFKVQVRINNIQDKLKPNIISVLHINDYTNKNAFIVPSIIIKRDMKGNFLFVAVEDPQEGMIAEKRYVETGKSFRDKTEVLDKLKEGDRVIVEGYNMVTTGTKIDIKDSK